MQVLKRLFDFYIQASVHVAFAVICLHLVVAHWLNISPDKNYIFFLFGGTVCCYNFMKYGVEAKKYRIYKKNIFKCIVWFSSIVLIVTIIFAIRLPKKMYLYLVFFTVISALYALPFLPSSKNLRSLGGLKIFLVAFVWAGLTVWVPYVSKTGLQFSQIGFVFLQVFVLVLILFVPFEVRDLKNDPIALKTIPQRIGIQQTKYLGYLLIALFALLGFGRNHQPIYLVLLMSILLFFIVWRTHIKNKEYYASFWVEGIPIVFYLIVEFRAFLPKLFSYVL